MKILITGGSGFLGRNLIERLVGYGHELSCLDRFEASFLKGFGVKMFQGDIYEKVLVDEAMAGQDIVIHLACTVIPKTSNDDPYFDVMSNIGGAIHLLDAAVANNVRRFVFLSSGGTVYGTPQNIPIKESHPTNPECSYGITKLTIEKYLDLYHRLHGISTCSIRLANPYGEHQRFIAAQGVIPVFCYKALKGEPIEIWGDGSVRRDFIYVEDAVEAIVRALDNVAAIGPLNIGSGESRSVNEILCAIEEILGKPLHRKYLAARSFDVPNNVLDTSRAKAILGWSPMVGFQEGMRRTLFYIEKQLI